MKFWSETNCCRSIKDELSFVMNQLLSSQCVTQVVLFDWSFLLILAAKAIQTSLHNVIPSVQTYFYSIVQVDDQSYRNSIYIKTVVGPVQWGGMNENTQLRVACRRAYIFLLSLAWVRLSFLNKRKVIQYPMASSLSEKTISSGEVTLCFIVPGYKHRK